MTRIPESKEFILKRVCRVPVQVPASMPAPNAASEASGGLTPWTSRVAATEAPRVMEPSAVISGNAKMRKLMNTPSASSERMQPMVKVPIRRLMVGALSLNSRQGADPAGAAHELTLLRAGGLAVVCQQVKNALQIFRFEECGDSGFQVDLALRQGAVGESRSVKMPEHIGAQRAQMWSDWTGRSGRGYPSNKGERARVQAFSGKRKPRANIRILERDAFRGGRTTKRGADQAS